VCWKTQTDEISVGRKKKRKKVVRKVKQDINEICEVCHMFHIAINIISYSLSGTLLERASNISPTGIYP